MDDSDESTNLSNSKREALKSLPVVHSMFLNNDSDQIEKFFQKDLNIIKGEIDFAVTENSKLACYDDRYIGYTALHFAIENGDFNNVKMLLDHGANIKKISSTGTPLHVAILFNKEQVFEELLNRGVDINAVSEDGWNGFHILFYFSHFIGFNLDSIKFWFYKLLNAGCNLNHVTTMGNTPLHYAPWELYQDLLDSGSDINILNNSGEVPMLSLSEDAFISDLEACFAAYKFIQKLRLIKYEVHEKNIDLCQFFIKNKDVIDEMDEYFNQTNLALQEKLLLDEIEKLKNIRIIKYENLYDLLFIDVVNFTENSYINTMIESEEFISNFINYGQLIRQNFQVARVRKKC